MKGSGEDGGGSNWLSPRLLREAVRDAIQELLPQLARLLAAEVAHILNATGWEIYVPLAPASLDRLQGLIWELTEIHVDLRQNAYLWRLRDLVRTGLSETQVRQIIMYHAWRWTQSNGGTDPWHPTIFDLRRVHDTLAAAAAHQGSILEWAREQMALRRLQSQIRSRFGGSSGTRGEDTSGRSIPE